MPQDDSCSQPLTYEIVAGRRATFEFREVWAYRELLYFLAWRECKVRYKQAVLGAAWALLQPLLLMLVFTIFFGRLIGVPSNGVPYAAFVYAGLLPWTFFSASVSNASIVFIAAPNLVTKIYFPRVLLPAASVLVALVDFSIGFALLLVYLSWYRTISIAVVLVPLIVFLVVVLATGVGVWAAALNVYYRDVRYALPFFIQLLLFASPVIYPARLVPQSWRWLLALNPLVGLIEAFRACIFGRAIDWAQLLIAIAATGLIFALTTYHFQKLQRAMADVI